MLGGPIDPDGLALGIPRPDPDPQFQFVIQALAGTESRSVLTCRQGLSAGAPHSRTRGTQGRRSAVIADRHVFIVGQQRVVRAEQLADIQRVMNTDVEVRVITHPSGHVQRALTHRQQQTGNALQPVALRAVFIEQLQQGGAQCLAGSGTQCKKIIELVAAGNLGNLGGRCLKHPGLCCCAQIENPVAYGHSATRAGLAMAEHAQRQVLQREIGMPVGRFDPATTIERGSHQRGSWVNVLAISFQQAS